MDWPGTVIWWHCYPLRFVGAEDFAVAAKHHRLGRLIDWFDYLITLGCNGLLLAPLFSSASHGYDTLDHFAIDSRLGDDADIDAVIAAAGQRGIRVLFDGVFNHLSADHAIVRRAVAAGPTTDDGRWLRWEGGHPRVFEGNFDLVELDLTHPPVADYVVEVMTHWLARGIDGWRLDAAYSPGAAAWRPIVERVKAAYPQCWILGEVIHGDYPAFVAESGVDSLTQYELWHAVWSSLNTANFHELDWTLGRHRTFCAAYRPQTFIGNHDVTRVASQLDDPRHLGLAIALLMLLPGIPSIYAGDEQAFTAEKLQQEGGDFAVRPPFPAKPEQLLPYGAATFELYQRLIAVRRRHPWLTDADLAVREVSNRVIVIDLSGDGESIVLALNISDDAVPVGDHTVAAHGWLVVEPGGLFTS
jgi:glycosidase